MLTDHWDIAHICIAVDDLESAMATYEAAYGVTAWGPLLEFSDENTDVFSPLHGQKVSGEGFREIWAKNGTDIVAGGPPFAPIELAHAQRFTPAFTIWGAETGKHYVHHICYWVDDLEAESAHLAEHGFALELTLAPGDRARGFAYHLSPTGMRIELMRREDKPAVATWLEEGESVLDWSTMNV